MIWHPAPGWLPAGRSAAVCLSIDDVHPDAAADGGTIGDNAREALDHLGWLLSRHPQLHATLFVTPDWRVKSDDASDAQPSCAQAGYDRRLWPIGTLRIDRHPAFVELLRSLPRTDIGLHGLHHVSRGARPVVEFADRSPRACARMLCTARRIMARAGLHCVAGLTPPGWEAPNALLDAMGDLGFEFIASARDLDTPITPTAHALGSGMRDVSLIAPDLLDAGGLVHLPTNFQATSDEARAFSVLDAGGLLSIKAHMLSRFGSYVALDGLTRAYVEALDRLFTRIEDRYGNRVWWTRMADVAAHVLARTRPSR